MHLLKFVLNNAQTLSILKNLLFKLYYFLYVVLLPCKVDVFCLCGVRPTGASKTQRASAREEGHVKGLVSCSRHMRWLVSNFLHCKIDVFCLSDGARAGASKTHVKGLVSSSRHMRWLVSNWKLVTSDGTRAGASKTQRASAREEEHVKGLVSSLRHMRWLVSNWKLAEVISRIVNK